MPASLLIKNPDNPVRSRDGEGIRFGNRVLVVGRKKPAAGDPQHPLPNGGDPDSGVRQFRGVVGRNQEVVAVGLLVGSCAVGPLVLSGYREWCGRTWLLGW